VGGLLGGGGVAVWVSVGVGMGVSVFGMAAIVWAASVSGGTRFSGGGMHAARAAMNMASRKSDRFIRFLLE